MQQFLATLVLVFPLMVLFMWLYGRSRAPHMRIHRDDLQDLIEDAIAGRARLERWELVTGMANRHDEDLWRWQARCRELSEGPDYEVLRTDRGPYCRFRPAARERLQRILQEISMQAETDQRRF